MPKNISFIFVILLQILFFSLCSNEFSRSDLEIPIAKKLRKEEFDEKFHYYEVKFEKVSGYNYIKLRFYPKERSNLRVFVSSNSKEPNKSNSEYQSFDPDRFIYLEKNFFEPLKVFYIGVFDDIPLQFSVFTQPVSSIDELSPPEYFSMTLSRGTNYAMLFNTTGRINTGNFIFSITGSSSRSKKNLSGKITYNYNGMDYMITLQPILHNGIGGIIAKEAVEKYDEMLFNFEFTSSEEDVVTVEFRQVINNGVVKLYPNEPTSIIFDRAYLNEISFSYYDEDVQSGDYIMQWRSYEDNLRPNLKKFNPEVETSVPSREDLPYSEYHTFCYSTSNSEKQKEYFNIMLRDYFIQGSVQLQLISRSIWEKENSVVISYVDFGIPVTGSVPNGQGQYFRFKRTPKNVSMYFLFQLFAGYPDFYIRKCKERFHNCLIEKDKIEDLVKEGTLQHVSYLNTFASEELYISREEEVFVFAYCPKGLNNDDCKFDLSVLMKSSMMYLSRNMRFSIPARKEKKNYFSFRITDPKTEEIEIILYTYSGIVDVIVSFTEHFQEKIGEYTKIGKKKSVKIKGSGLDKEFFVCVEAKSEGYYSIYYTSFISKGTRNYQVQAGEMVTETINKKEYEKIYTLLNINSSRDYTYIATFTALNCKISVSFQDESKIADRAEFKISSKDKIYSSGRYPFKVQFLSLDSGSSKEEENCIFYVTGNDQKSPLSLNEGVIHSMSLNSELNSIIYSYVLYNFGNEAVSISLTKLDSSPILFIYVVGDNDDKKYVVSSSRMFILQVKEIKDGCSKKSVCEILIEIKLEKPIEGASTQFEIGVTSNSLVPTYLRKGDIRFDGIFGKQSGFHPTFSEYVYYFTDLKQDSQCEVVIDFKRGSGKAVAVLYEKNEINKSFPKKDSTNLIPFDFYNKKIVLTEEQTNKCVDGCQLIVGVYSDIESNYFSFNEFSIFIREEETVVNLPPSEYAYGSLSKTEREGTFNYYRTLINKDTDRIILELNTEFCVGYININEDELPTKESYDFTIDSKTPILVIRATDSKIKDGTFLDKTITIAISTKSLDGKYNSFYSYRVMTPDRDQLNIIEINASESVTCKVENERCYFKMEIYFYHYVNQLFLYAFTEEGNQNDIEIYASVYNFEEFHQKEINNQASLLPNEKRNDFSSRGNLDADRISFPINKSAENSVHVYITVKSSCKGNIKLLSTFLQTPLKTPLRPNSYQMFFVEKGFSVDFEIFGDNMYYAEGVRVFGEGSIEIAESKKELNEEANSFAAIIKPTDSTKIRFTAESNFVFYVKYVVRADEGNFDELAFGRTNRVEYSESNFPITFYIPVDEKVNSDIVISFQINGESFQDKEEAENTEDFLLTAVIINENYIVSRKKAIDDNPEIEAYGSVFYNKELHLGKFIFKQEEILSCLGGNKKYFFGKIKQNINNVHMYQRVQLDVFATSTISNEISVPVNQYFYSMVDTNNPTLITMKKTSVIHKFIEVEFSLNSTDFDVFIGKGNDPSNLTQNDTTIEETPLNGKSLLKLEIASSNFAMIKLVPKNEKEEENISVMIKYRTFTKSNGHFVLSSDTILGGLEENGEYHAKIKPILYSNGALCRSAVYFLRLFEYNKYESKEVLNSLGNIDLSFKSFFGKFDQENEQITFDIPNFPKGNFYVNVLGTAVDGSDKEHLLYSTQVIFTPRKFQENNSIFICLLIFFVLIFILLLLYLFRIIKRTESKQKSEIIEYSVIK